MTFHVANGVAVDINVNPGTTAATMTGSTTAAITGGGGVINITSADLNGGAASRGHPGERRYTVAAVTKINTALGATCSSAGFARRYQPPGADQHQR